MKYMSKIFNVLQKDGVLVLFIKIINRIKILIIPYFDYWFDLKHGVNTCAVMFQDDVSGMSPERKEEIVRYEPTPVDVARSVLEKLPIDYSEYTFIDYGSGKARVLLLASEYPFKKIIGVELFKCLIEIARKNFKVCKNLNQKCIDIEMRCANATQFRLPNDPLVIFFFTPFKGMIMDQVAGNIKESLNNTPRPIHIVYYGSRDEIIKMFSDMNVTHKEIYSKRPLSATGNYKAHLFSSRATS
jgi:hypothetical protein